VDVVTEIPAASPAPPETPIRTGLARAVLAETAERLAHLARTGESDAVDRAGLPMTPGDYQELDDRLGRGEVAAELDVAGRTEVWETAYAGVWRVRHRGAGDVIAVEELLITLIPDILKSHPEDCRAAAERLESALATDRADRNSRFEEHRDG
jgi:hydrogenase-1 operon protein HyaF